MDTFSLPHLAAGRKSGGQMKRLFGISVLLVLAMVLAACSSAAPTANAANTPANTSGGNPSASGNTVSVSMKNLAFNPKDITIKVGTTVVWTNNDSVDHNVTSATGLFNSGNLAPGDTFKFTFDQAGTYPYSCTIHVPDMVGTVTVTQ